MTFFQDQIEDALAFQAHEMGRGADAQRERRWLRWVGVVEVDLDIETLDGSDCEDGYSLDTAYDLFEAGYTPQQAAALFRRRIAETREGIAKAEGHA